MTTTTDEKGIASSLSEDQRIEDAEDQRSGKDMKESGVFEGALDYSGAVRKSNPLEIALVKKLDWRIMPTLWAMYFLNYLDRSAIASARLNDLEEDLGLVGSQYNTCISILFIGYLIMQVPSNMLMNSGKVRPSIYMGLCMALWAIVSALTSMVKNYTGLVLVRFFLGVTEAPFYPGALYMLSIFYTRKEIAARIAILYSGNIFATAFAGLIAAAIFETLDDAHGLAGWKWLFIIEGAVTFVVALVAIFLLPDDPLTTRWLSPDEQQLAHSRIAKDTVNLAPNKGAIAGLKQAVKDPLFYPLILMQNFHISACSFNNFFPTVVGSLGFNRTLTLVLTCPPYLVSGFVGWFLGLSSGKFNERTWHITGAMGTALVGFIISCISLDPAARYVACFLFASGAYAINSVILGWCTATLGQTTEKKAVSLGLINTFANLSYVYTAYLYPKSDGPRYLTAMSANSAFAVATIMVAWGLKLFLVRKNKQLRASNPATVLYYAH
ncbi:vitamin H transporter [Bisporella sp. PMI_857]|nr:vitamin H transporter [Bisporella sp. PMI_857]